MRELVNTVHTDYADLKQTIAKQKNDLQQELVDKIDQNSQQLNIIAQENKSLKKENDLSKMQLDKLEQNQLSNNIMVTVIQEGPYEQSSTTKLRIQEMIVITINSENSADDLETAKKIEITSCNRVGKFRHIFLRPVVDLHTKVSGMCPPNRTKFFHFYKCFHQKAPVLEVGAPNGKSWIHPWRPISVTFAKRDDKEAFLSNTRQLPSRIFTNEEFPLHIK